MKLRSRRRFLTAACGLATAGAMPRLEAAEPPTQAKVEALQAAIRKVVGTATVHTGKVKLDLPPLVENGNGVPLAVTVEHPMTPTDHVKAIHIFNEKNPLPEIVSFHLGPRAGRARVETRVRLADTQTVIAIAELSDGSFWSGSAGVIVTLAACLEEL